jgi:hypothetical protein
MEENRFSVDIFVWCAYGPYQWIDVSLSIMRLVHPDFSYLLMGLLNSFDQIKMLAIIQPTIDDEGVTMNGRQQWLPLETILDAYIDMIDRGKIKAVDGTFDTQYQVMTPWAMFPYSDHDLRSALDAFHNLVDAISSLLPNLATEDLGPLADETTIEAANLGGFAREFLLGAK